MIDTTFEKPYYAVIFTSIRKSGDDGYEHMADETFAAVQTMDGFLGAESLRDENGFGVTISYWKSLDGIERWKNHVFHQAAKEKGKSEWYSR